MLRSIPRPLHRISVLICAFLLGCTVVYWVNSPRARVLKPSVKWEQWKPPPPKKTQEDKSTKLYQRDLTTASPIASTDLPHKNGENEDDFEIGEDLEWEHMVHGCQNCHPTKPDMLNVHLVPHSHDDVGWVKTVMEYYKGDDNRLTGGYQGCVKCTIDTVIHELEQNPERRYIQVEAAFFWMWWQDQTFTKKRSVKNLVKEGRLEFAGGGWSMNDEAAAHYTGIIDNMSVGFAEFKRHFGRCGAPRVGWQIDPFGHSREQAALFAMMGFNAWFFPRIDDKEKAQRKKDGFMQFVWEGSDSVGEPASLFTEILPDHYYPPKGFNFDAREIKGNQNILTDKTDDMIRKKVMDLISKVKGELKGFTNQNHHILTMGGDFHYANATRNFENMDLLIEHANSMSSETGVHLIYSTPSCFVKALHEDKSPTNIQAQMNEGFNDINETEIKLKNSTTWRTMTDKDFFPYATGTTSSKMWTGYFTSRPAFKLHERDAHALLQSARQAKSFFKGEEGYLESLTVLQRAIGVSQHHDAITGTAKTHVDKDYHRMLADGEHLVQSSMGKALFSQMSLDEDPIGYHCPLLNISQCAITEDQDRFAVVIYNSLPRPRSVEVRLPIGDKMRDVSIRDPQNNRISSNLTKIDKDVSRILERTSEGDVEMSFLAKGIPALGYKTFFVEKQSSSSTEITWKGTTLDQMQSELPHGLQIALKYYETPHSRGGAYTFHPVSSGLISPNTTGVLVADFGRFKEFRVKYTTDWLSLVVRKYQDEEEGIEVEWVVGPIPVENHTAREVIIVFYCPSITSVDTFYTDSNGRQFMKRKKRGIEETKETISGNYYPVNGGMYLTDSKNLTMGVVNDRSQGGSSLKMGQIELMVHRRLVVDDGLGVTQVLSETPFEPQHGLEVRGKHWVKIGQKNDVLRWQRLAMQSSHYRPTFLFAPMKKEDSIPTLGVEFGGLAQDLPENVHILTLEPISDYKVLLRLEHLFAPDEHPHLSQEAQVDLADMFSTLRIHSIEETTLGGNIPLSKLVRLHWNTDTWNESSGHNATHSASKTMDSTIVTLKPMQIRTFLLDIL